MTTRLWLSGICMVVLCAGSAMAQTAPPATNDAPIPSKPPAVNEPAKPPATVPEIIKDPDVNGGMPRPRVVADPGSVLTPPTVDLEFLRAIRLDWDRMGTAPEFTEQYH